MQSKEIIENIKRWNPYCENITLATIFAKMRFNRGSNHVINFGPPGSGKSQSTLVLLEQLNLGTEIIIDNTTTDKGLFEVFQNYPEQDIILDECSTLLKNAKTQDMVKLAMEGKELHWTKDGSTETADPYKGNLVINANVPIADSVVDRSLLNKTVMNKEMALSFNDLYVEHILKESKSKKPKFHEFEPFFKYIKKTVTDPKVPELTNDEINMVLEFVKSKLYDIDQDRNYSRRIIIRELSYFQRAKKLFRSLDKNVLEFIKPYAEAYIINAHTPGLIESILGNGSIEKAALVKRMAKEGGFTEQHARRLINKKIDEGKLKLVGKMICLIQ